MELELLLSRTYSKSVRLGACDRFVQCGNMEEISNLLFSPQGIEFCTKRNFPDVNLMRGFKAYDAEGYGIYIDSGDISLSDKSKICLVGNTCAELTFDDPMESHTVVLLHGAKAHIKATGYAVVFVYASKDCTVIKTVNDNAKIL